ncbi:MAG: hypothetical protein GTO17_07910 [Candidatus Aminicenantes bacterium]|nr:hypothetical protein [Candidatus Aminicenantes bacterium]
MSQRAALLGTITHDLISYESGLNFEGIGGVLYQAAVLCGLEKEVSLYTNLGAELVPQVKEIIESWSHLDQTGIQYVPGPGNRVELHYPEKGEREEVLKSVVPPLGTAQIVKELPGFGMLLLVLNSGFDIELKDWKKITDSASCPAWIDIHSLALAKKLQKPRGYVSLADWEAWVEGVDYLQANKQEVASMLGHPQRLPDEEEIARFGKRAMELGVKAVFMTLGQEGGIVMIPEGLEKIASSEAESVVDTTGCGDVFCGATAARLMEGKDPVTAACFGLELATKAVNLTGVEETYLLTLHHGRGTGS